MATSKQGWHDGIYHDRRGEWMLSRDIEGTFQIPQWKIEQWGKKPCPYLRGRRTVERKEVANPFPGATGFNETIYVYLVSDVEEIVAHKRNGAPVATEGTWLDQGIFEDAAGERWISAKGAESRYHIQHNILWRGAKRCRYLGGRPIRKIVIEVRHARSSHLFALADVEEIHARMLAPSAPPPEYRDDDGAWLTNAQMRERFGVSSIFCVWWSKKRWKGAPALRMKTVFDLRRRVNGLHVPVYLLSDAEAIRRREKSKRKYQGRGAISDEYKKGLAEDAERVLRLILRDGPVDVCEIERQADDCHITRSILHRARKALGDEIILNGDNTWSLRGVKAKPAAAPSTHADFSHIKTIAVGAAGAVNVAESANTNVISGAWITVADAAELSGVHRATIHRAVKGGKIKHKGTVNDLLIDSADFNRWQLERSRRPEAGESDAAVSRKLQQAENDAD